MSDPLAMDVPDAAPVTPDPLDWAATLARPCPVCGFSAGDVDAAHVADALVAAVAPWQEVLARPDVRVRPQKGRWAPLEYACHVQDLAVVVAARVDLVLDVDEPLVEDWDQNLAALDGAYLSRDPAEQAEELADVTEMIVARLERVGDQQWSRVARTSRGQRVTLREVVLRLVHDARHHLVEIGA